MSENRDPPFDIECKQKRCSAGQLEVMRDPMADLMVALDEVFGWAKLIGCDLEQVKECVRHMVDEISQKKMN